MSKSINTNVSLTPEKILSADAEHDRNFDDLADRFCRNIYGTTKGRIRQVIVNEDLEQWYTQVKLKQQGSVEPLHIIEAGGGDGRSAVAWALKGERVTFCDISEEMIKRARHKALEAGVADKIEFLHLPAQSLAQAITQKADLLICHAVLEWIAKPDEFIMALKSCIKEGGTLSLMFYNADAAFFRNAIMGNFNALLKGQVNRVDHSLVPMYPLSMTRVEMLLATEGFEITQRTGVRVFHDYLHFPKQRENDFDALLALEQRYCRCMPYVLLGRYIHLLAIAKSY